MAAPFPANPQATPKRKPVAGQAEKSMASSSRIVRPMFGSGLSKKRAEINRENGDGRMEDNILVKPSFLETVNALIAHIRRR
jgi:hypothetical protein